MKVPADRRMSVHPGAQAGWHFGGKESSIVFCYGFLRRTFDPANSPVWWISDFADRMRVMTDDEHDKQFALSLGEAACMVKFGLNDKGNREVETTVIAVVADPVVSTSSESVPRCCVGLAALHRAIEEALIARDLFPTTPQPKEEDHGDEETTPLEVQAGNDPA